MAELSRRAGVSRPTLYRLDTQGIGAVSAGTRKRVRKVLGEDAQLLDMSPGLRRYLGGVVEENSALRIKRPFTPEEATYPIAEVFLEPSFREVRPGGAQRLLQVPLLFGRPSERRSMLGRLLAEHTCLLVTGEPGSGKTTLLRYLAHTYAAGEQGSRHLPGPPRIPILVDLQVLAREPDAGPGRGRRGGVARAPSQALGEGPREALGGLLRSLLRRAGLDAPADAGLLPRSGVPYLLLFDGLDTLPPGKAAGVLDAVRGLAGTVGDDRVRIVITSRSPIFLAGDGPTAIKALRLSPLHSFQQRKLATVLAGKLVPGDVARQEDLVRRIVRDPAISTLARNPLLLTLSVLVFASRGAVPPRVSDVIGAIVDSFLSAWGSDDPLRSERAGMMATWIGPREILRVLEDLALELRQEGGASLPRARWYGVSTAALRSFGLDERDADRVSDGILRFLIGRCGLLVEVEGEALTFLHSMIHDYLASRSLRRRERLMQFLRDRWHDARWRGVILFVIEALDPALAGRCLREMLDDPDPLGAWLGRGLLTALTSLARDPPVYDQRLIHDLFSRLRSTLENPPPGFGRRLHEVLVGPWPPRLRGEVHRTLLDVSLSEAVPERSWTWCMRVLADTVELGRGPVLEWLRRAGNKNAAVQGRVRVLYRHDFRPEMLGDAEIRRRLKEFVERSRDPVLARCGTGILDYHVVQLEEYTRHGLLGGPDTHSRVAEAVGRMVRFLGPDDPADVKLQVLEEWEQALFTVEMDEVLERIQNEDPDEDVRAKAHGLRMDIHGAWDDRDGATGEKHDPPPRGSPDWAVQTGERLADGSLEWNASLAEEVIDVLRGAWVAEGRDKPLFLFLWEDLFWRLLDARTLREPRRDVAAVVREALEPYARSIRAAFLFGSRARGEMTPESDVDLFVMGDVGLSDLAEPLREAEERLNRVINPVVRSAADVRRLHDEGSAFLHDVFQREKQFLIGGENELGEVVGVRLATEAGGEGEAELEQHR